MGSFDPFVPLLSLSALSWQSLPQLEEILQSKYME